MIIFANTIINSYLYYISIHILTDYLKVQIDVLQVTLNIIYSRFNRRKVFLIQQ